MPRDRRGPCLKANCVGSSIAWVLAPGWFEPLLFRAPPPPRFSGGWPTGGFHGGFVASQCGSSRTAGPGFHLCSGTMRPISCAGVGDSGRGSTWADWGTVQLPACAVIPCSETCLTRKFLFGVLRSRGVPLSFGYCKWAIFSLYLLRVFFSSPSSHLLLRFFSA